MPSWTEKLAALELVGRVGWATFGFVFMVAVFLVTSARDHADFAEADIQLKRDISASQTLYGEISADLRVLTSEVMRDRELGEERRLRAQRDRDEIKRQLNMLLERL